MAQNRSVEAALLAWVFEDVYISSGQFANSLWQVRTFPLESKVDSFADLSDGFVLSKMLGGCSSGASLSSFIANVWMLTTSSLQRISIQPMP